MTVATQDWAQGTTLWDLLLDRTRLTPDALMLVDDRDRTMSFAEFVVKAERVAAGLYERGVRESSAVSWQLPTRIETVLVSMALSRLGALQNPIISLYREREVGSLLRNSNASMYIVQGVWNGFDYAAMGEALTASLEQPCEVLALDSLDSLGIPEDDFGGLPDGDPSILPPVPTKGSIVRWLYSTSGTTSEPKVVLHTDQTLIAGGHGIAMRQQFPSSAVLVIAFPYAHIGGPDNFVMQLECGAAALLMESFVPTAAVTAMRKHGATSLGGSTAHYIAILAEQRKNPSEVLVPTLKTMVGGGAPLPPEVYWQCESEAHVRIHHGYGMTECPMIACGGPEDTGEELANTEGKPVVGAEIRILDDQDQPLPVGVDGEIAVRGPMLMKGYGSDEQNRESFLSDGFFRTGDRGHLRASGHIVLTGRSKELIIRKGENISPKEIEDILATHPSVAAVAVIGLADPSRGERVCAVLELRVGAATVSLQEIQTLCREQGLMIQKTPEQLEIVDALPRNPTMKILKRELVTRFS
jgi:cyclohexanecarboxylate-CoA ligase